MGNELARNDKSAKTGNCSQVSTTDIVDLTMPPNDRPIMDVIVVEVNKTSPRSSSYLRPQRKRPFRGQNEATRSGKCAKR